MYNNKNKIIKINRLYKINIEDIKYKYKYKLRLV